MTGFGENVRTERERRGLSLAQMCAQTKISERQLQAIERENYAELPPGVFRRGMVRAYLSALELDLEPWMASFQASYERALGTEPDVSAEAWEQFAENVKRNRISSGSRNSWRWVGVAVLLLALCAAGYAVWHFLLLPRLR